MDPVVAVDARSYMPFLKGKLGERLALADLSPSSKAAITPVFEVLSGRSDDQLTGEVRQVARKWANAATVLFDTAWAGRATGPDHPLELVSRIATTNNLAIGPVVRGTSDPDDLKAAARVVKNHGRGAGLRLTAGQWSKLAAAAVIDPVLDAIALDPSQVDLILDVGHLATDGHVSLHRNLVSRAFAELPHFARWRRVVILAGSMPASLSQIKPSQSADLVRREWMLWTSLPKPARTITYGDFGVANAEAPDDLLNPKAIPLYAQLRYTNAESFSIVKGRDIKTYGPDELYRVCRRVTKLPGWMAGPFSIGDAWIATRAAGAGKTGNYMTWRKVATVHHITKVVSLLSSSSGT